MSRQNWLTLGTPAQSAAGAAGGASAVAGAAAAAVVSQEGAFAIPAGMSFAPDPPVISQPLPDDVPPAYDEVPPAYEEVAAQLGQMNEAGPLPMKQ